MRSKVSTGGYGYDIPIWQLVLSRCLAILLLFMTSLVHLSHKCYQNNPLFSTTHPSPHLSVSGTPMPAVAAQDDNSCSVCMFLSAICAGRTSSFFSLVPSNSLLSRIEALRAEQFHTKNIYASLQVRAPPFSPCPTLQ